MNAIEKLERIYAALFRRRVGNTTLMKIGTDQYDRPFFVIGHTKEYAIQIAKGNSNAKGITLLEIDEMNGWDAPVAIDHHLLTESIRQVGMELDGMRQEIKSLRFINDLLSQKCNRLMSVKPGHPIYSPTHGNYGRRYYGSFHILTDEQVKDILHLCVQVGIGSDVKEILQRPIEELSEVNDH